MDDSAFPAIARVTERFHALRVAQPLTVTVDHDSTIVDKAVETSLMRKLARDLDDDLELIHADIEQIHTNVATETRLVIESIDKLTAAFARGYHFDKWEDLDATPTNPRARHAVTSRRRHHVKHRTTIPRVGLRLTIQSAPIGTTTRIAPGTRETDQAAVKHTVSRASRLAIEALSATTIQRAVQRFFYSKLYRRGLQQLRAALVMQRRCRQNRWLRRWCVFVLRGRRVRRKLERREASSAEDMVVRCIAQAERVVETDGKFAMAKEYHRLRRLGEVLLAWMRATTIRDDIAGT